MPVLHQGNIATPPPVKTVREASMEAFVDRLVYWLSGKDDGFRPFERVMVRIKALLIILAFLGVIVPIVGTLLGIFLVHVCIDGIPTAVHLAGLTVFGLSIAAFYFRHPILGFVFLGISVVECLAGIADYFQVFDAPVWGQWIMAGGILFFGLPALLVLGFGASAMATILHRFIWKKTPVYRLRYLIEQYFSVVIWLYVIGEVGVFVGITSPLEFLLVLVMGGVGWILMSSVWDKGIGVGRLGAFVMQIVLVVWAGCMALSPATSMHLFGRDLRHELGFYHVKPFALQQREFDRLQRELFVAEGESIKTKLGHAETAITHNDPETAKKIMEGIKEPYKENPLVPRFFGWVKRQVTSFANWISSWSAR